jgi:ATP phosphoribosyltransferase regulatory subunit
MTTPSTTNLTPPDGMRDVLPPEAEERRALMRTVSESLELFGYALVVPPAFERAALLDVLLAGSRASQDAVRFVDPMSGEAAVFRPDITPQVARIVATRLGERPSPFRLYYEGEVLRTRRGRARRQRQVAQIGAECIGIPGAPGDAETIEAASSALRATGLEHTIELALVPLARSLVRTLHPDFREDVLQALSLRDRSALEKHAMRAQAPADLRSALVALIELSGDASVIAEAKRWLAPFDVEGHLQTLDALRSELEARDIAGKLRFDFGEVRGFDYYTGPSFSLLSRGPGEPIGGGGRYDALLGRIGPERAASGFAIDIDNLDWALRAQHPARNSSKRPRLAVVDAHAVSRALRSAGWAVSSLPAMSRDESLRWAETWSHDAVVIDGEIHWLEGSRVAETARTEAATRVRESLERKVSR